MLAAYTMGSHGGQQNFPFGYIPNELHGIGLPDFMTPGPPPGQPLLNEHDNQALNSFFSGFDAGGDAGKNASMQQLGDESGVQGQDWALPPTFVGSETSLHGRIGTEWQNFSQGEFGFDNDPNLAQMSSNTGFQPLPPGFPTGHYDTNLLLQLQNAAHAIGGQNFDSTWQQSFNGQPVARGPPKPAMRFGSDQHFQPGGYAAPEGQVDPTPNLDWLEPHSSATNTQPNTQPSSPVWTKKRKLDDFRDPSQRNGLVGASPIVSGAGSTQITTSRQGKKASRKQQAISESSTPISGQISAVKQEAETSTPEDEEDDDKSSSPAGWTGGKARAPNSSKSSAPKALSRKKSSASSTPGKSKTKSSRASAASHSARVPLTADQKKTNHTNSEQRRRDATARAYAELYDLVPELEDLGKQSTMKKLEVVVEKVARVKERVAYLRSVLGLDGDIDISQPPISPYPSQMNNMFSGDPWQR